jgi:hypothetical protein
MHQEIANLKILLEERATQIKIINSELEKLKNFLAKKEDEILILNKKLLEKDSIISNLNIEISKHQGLREETQRFRQLFEEKNKELFNITIKFSEYEKIISDAKVALFIFI